jgi:hypothetical protein
MPHTKSGRLSWWQFWLIAGSGAALWLSGAAWVLLHYFGEIQGEFGPEVNPAQPWLLRVHGFVLITALVGFGSILVVHIPKGWNDRDQRIVGIMLTSMFSLLILSGYFLYYVGDDYIRELTSLFHWIVGVSAPAVFLWHYNNRYANRRTKKSKKNRVITPTPVAVSLSSVSPANLSLAHRPSTDTSLANSQLVSTEKNMAAERVVEKINA